MKLVRYLLACAACVFASPAVAHHPIGSVTPSSLTEGLLSGLGHPIIGIDHLLFILASGVVVFYFGQRARMLVALSVGAMAGTLAHVQWPGLPYHDGLVALSLVLLGVLMVRRDTLLSHAGAAGVFAVSGIAHGYAYGEAIVGAEATPLLAYLAGFTLIQLALALSAFAAVGYLSVRAPRLDVLKVTGTALSIAGAAILCFALLPQIIA